MIIFKKSFLVAKGRAKQEKPRKCWVSSFLEKMVILEASITNGVPLMAGSMRDFTISLKKKSWYYHSRLTSSKRGAIEKFWEIIFKTYGDATKKCLFIKQRVIHSKMFKSLWKTTGQKNTNVLLPTDIWWLAKEDFLTGGLNWKVNCRTSFKKIGGQILLGTLKIKNSYRNQHSKQTFLIPWTSWISLCKTLKKMSELKWQDFYL